MPDTIDAIQRRLELAGYLPEQFGNGNSAADRWHEDVTTLLAEVERLRAVESAARAYCDVPIDDPDAGALYRALGEALRRPTYDE